MARLNSTITTAVHNKVCDSIDKINKSFNMNIDYPTVTFDLKGMAAGQAVAYRNGESSEIRINPVILSENVDDVIRQVVPHEVAHVAVRKIYGWHRNVKPHGIEWKNMMHILGVPAITRHKYNVKNAVVRNTKYYVYKCVCNTYTISSVRHNKQTSGLASYTCPNCGDGIIFTGKVTTKKALLSA